MMKMYRQIRSLLSSSSAAQDPWAACTELPSWPWRPPKDRPGAPPPPPQAVGREDYDAAKRLKGAVDRLRAAGGAIAELEARKRAAVEEEDYDLAKQLKAEVDRMR